MNKKEEEEEDREEVGEEEGKKIRKEFSFWPKFCMRKCGIIFGLGFLIW